MSKPKVLIFSTAYFPLVGGAEVAVKELTDRLVDYDFVMVTARINRAWPKVEQIGRVEVHRIGFGSRFDKFILMFFGARLAAKLHAKNNFSSTWAIMASYGGFAAARFKRQHKTVPYLLTLQEGDDLKSVERKVLPVWFWFKSIFTRADQVQCISNYLADWARRFKVDDNKISVVPNGVDLEKFQSTEISLDKKVIITTSRLVPKNGVGDLIEAMTLLPRQVTLQIYGQGNLREVLEQKVKHLHLSDRVKFFGYVLPNELPSKLAQASVFCRPALSEGLGNSFLEAMAIGLPTVGTPVGGIVDFLHDPLDESGREATGWLCEPKNPQSIAKKIAFILDPAHKDEVWQIAKNGQAHVRANYSWDTVTGKMGQILAELTSGR